MAQEPTYEDLQRKVKALEEETAKLKLSGKAMRESEAKFHTLFMTMNEGMVLHELLLDADGRALDYLILDVNGAFERITGIPRERAVGQKASELYGTGGAPYLDIYAQVALTGEPTAFETTFNPMGRTFLISVFSPARGQFATVFEDITERKRSEEALRESEEKYRDLFERSSDLLCLHDLQGKLLETNVAFRKSYGWTKEDVRNRNIRDFIPGDYRHEFDQYLDRIREKGHDEGFMRALTKDGRVLTLQYRNSLVLDANGVPVMVRGSARDVTGEWKAAKERQKLEEQLRQSQKMEAIGTLAGGIAHDFNNILGVIFGCTELTLMETSKESRAWENLNEVYKAAQRAKDLVKQILTFSRQAPQERKPLRVDLVAKEALKFLRSSLPSTIEIQQVIVESPGKIMGDITQVHQVIMNLCVNAGHAMREKGGVLRVEVENADLDAEEAALYGVQGHGPYCRLKVSDTGHGMDDSVVSRIFDPFFTTKGPEEGTGLGLAVVHGIVKSHGGGIIVKSKPGKGTTFEVVFPRMEKAPEAELPTRSELPLGKGERILVVDDEPGLAHMCCEMLNSLGYRTESWTSSVDALQAFSAKPDDYDLVLTDMTMPHLTGLDLSTRILAIRPHLPIILLTGFSEGINEEVISGQGITALLAKPIGRRQLAEAVRTGLGGKKTNSALE